MDANHGAMAMGHMTHSTRRLASLLALVMSLSGLNRLWAAQPIVGGVYDHPGDLLVRPLDEATTVPYHVQDRRLSRVEKLNDPAFCTFDRPGALTVLAMDDRTVVARYDAEGLTSARSCASGTIFQLAPAEFHDIHPLADVGAARSNADPDAKTSASMMISVLLLLLCGLVIAVRAFWMIGSPLPRIADGRVDTTDPPSQPPAEVHSAEPPPTGDTRAKNIRL
jgi:hypothetical protein